MATNEKGMTVTGRVKSYKQPYGGFIPPRSLTRIQFEDAAALGPENVHPSTIGTAVDYLTRLMTGEPVEDAFHISLLGAMRGGCYEQVLDYTQNITGLDDKSISAACTVVMFDSLYRAGVAPTNDPFELDVDEATCANIRIMVQRGLSFFEKYGPITDSAPVFPGGYTDTVTNGDGDFLTKDTLWDFKVSKNNPTNQNTLQLAMYFLMGKHSTNKHFETVEKIGIFNPRLNAAFILDMSTVPKDVIRTIEKDVIGYP